MLDHIIAVIMRGLLLPWSAGAASSKQPEDCICCRGEGVSQDPTCDGVSPPAQPDCFNLYLDSAAYDRDGYHGPLWPVCAGHFLNRAIFVIESSPR